MEKLNYDSVADIYEFRYQRSYQSNGISKKLKDIALNNNVKRILEVGCGTGHWLRGFPEHDLTIGLDESFGMLSKANSANRSFNLIQGTSSQLPFRKSSFDFIYCINAIHHFENPFGFIKNCRHLLNAGGIVVIVCMNPHSGSDNWFIYDYFNGTYERDIQRYPSPDKIKDWLVKAGFKNINFQIGERLQNRFIGEEVFPIPKGYTSQLSLISDKEYTDGLNKIKNSIISAKSNNKEIKFKVDISLSMATAYITD